MTKWMFRQFSGGEKHVGNAFGYDWSMRPNWLVCADALFHMATHHIGQEKLEKLISSSASKADLLLDPSQGRCNCTFG